MSPPTHMNIDTQSLVMNKNAGPTHIPTVPMKALPGAVVEGRGPTARGIAVWKGPLDAEGERMSGPGTSKVVTQGVGAGVGDRTGPRGSGV